MGRQTRRLPLAIHAPRAGANDKGAPTSKRFVVGGGLARLLQGGEDWLTHRILDYAKRQGFTRYTSTLAEAWRLSISGLTASLVTAIDHFGSVPELGPDEADGADPVASFAMIEAERHRARGVTLLMFLGLYKYYRQSYLDWVEQARVSIAERRLGAMFVGRVFDRIEVVLCAAWASKSEPALLDELQRSNRAMTNEKNAYLTVFESVLTPVLVVDVEGHIQTLNHAASKLVRATAVPGAAYYGEAPTGPANSWHPRGQPVEALFPWLPQTSTLLADHEPGAAIECNFADEQGPRVFEVRASKLMDVSEKMIGTVVLLSDVTEHKALVARLDCLARTDGLTGIDNRRHFLELAQRETVRARRYSRELSVLVIDLDYFKRVNDTYGHAVGDELLIALTRSVSETLRATDAFGRLGGEEFAVLLPETANERAVRAAERIRSRVAQLTVLTDAGPVRATVSVGVATLDDSDQSLDALLIRADDALYRAKSLGRNRVVPASSGRLRRDSGLTSAVVPERPADAGEAPADVKRGALRNA